MLNMSTVCLTFGQSQVLQVEKSDNVSHKSTSPPFPAKASPGLWIVTARPNFPSTEMPRTKNFKSCESLFPSHFFLSFSLYSTQYPTFPLSSNAWHWAKLEFLKWSNCQNFCKRKFNWIWWWAFWEPSGWKNWEAFQSVKWLSNRVFGKLKVKLTFVTLSEKQLDNSELHY